MNFSAVHFNGETIGYEHRSKTHLFFFGTELGTFEHLQTRYPDLLFCRVQQVHGDTSVEAQPFTNKEALAQADAHWTTQARLAPVVLTADCLPVLLTHPKWVAAIHAGWRGVHNEILVKTVAQLNARFGDADQICGVIGPHIATASFEVDRSLADEFLELYKRRGGHHEVLISNEKNPAKANIDLFEVASQQLRSAGITNVSRFSADTKTDLRFASYRRQKENTCRNFSFVTRLAD